MTEVKKKTVNILMADDDTDYCSLMGEALKQVRWAHEFRYVIDGEELIDYLSRKTAPPNLILLDLNMPRKSGFEALKEIRTRPEWCGIPVIVFTISKDRRDVLRSYELGANTFITKPFSFDAMIKTLQALQGYWFECAELP